MGTLRTSFAWLVALSTVGLVSALPHVTLADDVGPGKEVRAIRHDVPALLASTESSPIAVESVLVNGDEATASWSDARNRGRAYLARKFDRWWLQLGAASASTPSTDVTFATSDQHPTQTQGYDLSVRFAPNDAAASAKLADVNGRAPTEAESWMSSGGNSYFFFSGTVQSASPIRVDAGTTIDVWFPFVLDPSLHYALTVAYADKPIGPIDGTLRNNVVHFVLPPFSLTPGAHLMGEIEGDAWAHYTPR